MQRRLGAVDAVQVLDPALHAGMRRVGEAPPFEHVVVVPFGVLRELAAHEQQLLARVRPHVAEQQPQVGEALPVVARHLAEQRALAVHHLVVRERQHEVLAEGVDEREGQLAVVPAAVHRVVVHVLQGVVHPAHVPLQAEAEATEIGRPRHHRPGGRFLGDQLHVGVLAVGQFVELAQEADRLQVLAAAVAVGDPLAFLARVVEVEHRRDAVHAQAVEVVFVEPHQRAREQERAHLVAPVVEDGRVPFRVEALARVGMLVQVGAVEAGQAVRVGREVRRHPVEDHADARAVQGIDEGLEVLRRAVARGRREVARRLVAPGAVERVLGDRHQLDVGEAQARDVVGEQEGRAAVVEQRPVRAAPPRAEMHLVGGDRCVERIAPAARGHPLGVVPGMACVAPGDRGRRRWRLGAARERVGLLEPFAAARADRELVALAGFDARHLGLPQARTVAARVRRVRAAAPAVEVADHGDGPGVRRPDRETGRTLAQLATQLAVQPAVGSLEKEIDVLFADGLRRGKPFFLHGLKSTMPHARRRDAISRHLTALAGRACGSSRAVSRARCAAPTRAGR